MTRPTPSPSATDFAALPAIAREAIRARLARESPTLPAAHSALARAAPVFVTLRIDGQLRGCIGSLAPFHTDLVAEVADRACAAAFEDPRFPPLSSQELAACSIEVSVLGALEDVAGPHELDPRRYGVEVRDGHGRVGVLLPDIPGVDHVDEQIAIARAKAHIPTGAPLRLRRFRVTKVTE